MSRSRAAAIVALALARSVSDPLQKLSRATEEIARGNYDHQVPVTGQDEVSRLDDGFWQ